MKPITKNKDIMSPGVLQAFMGKTKED